MPHKAADPEIIKVLLKQEIIRLGIQNNPSRTVYQDRYHRARHLRQTVPCRSLKCLGAI